MFHREIHAAALFLNEEYNPVLSIENEELDYRLSNIKHTAKANYNLYKDDLVKNHKYGFDRGREPVFITKEEREEFNKISNKNKDFIVAKLFSMLQLMPDQIVVSELNKSLGTAPHCSRKDVLIEMYNEIADSLELQNSLVTVCEEFEFVDTGYHDL